MQAAEGSFETNLSLRRNNRFRPLSARGAQKLDYESISLDGTGAMLPTYSMGSQKLYVMLPNQSTIDNAKTKIAEYLKYTVAYYSILCYNDSNITQKML